MAVSRAEFTQAMNECTSATNDWELFVGRDPGHLLGNLEPAVATDEQRAIMVESLQQNLRRIMKALKAAERVVELAPDYHLHNGPRIGRRIRRRKTVEHYQGIAVMLRAAFIVFAKDWQRWTGEDLA